MYKKNQFKNIKKGSLSRQLDISIELNIPTTLLKKIKNANIGTVVVNPTKIGKRLIKVTPLLKKRVVLALNFKGFKK